MPHTYEELLAFIEARLSKPITQDRAPDGSRYFVGGDPAEVIVRVTSSTVTVSEYAIRWEGPHAQVVWPIRIGSFAWTRVSVTDGARILASLIEAARQSRLGTFVRCAACETAKPPEWMHDDDVCQSCAERESSRDR